MQTSAPSRHLPIRKDWLAATQEPALEPDRPIIDPHHHLWDRPGNRYLLHDLIEDLSSGHNIRATVFLECREMYRAEGPPELRSLGETHVCRRCGGDERERQIRPGAGPAPGSSAMSISASAAAPRASSSSTSSLRAGASAASATAPPGTPTRASGSSPRAPAKGSISTAPGAKASPHWRRSTCPSRRGCSTASSATWSTSPAPSRKPRSC